MMEKNGAIGEGTPQPGSKCCGGSCKTAKPAMTKESADRLASGTQTDAVDAVAQQTAVNSK